MASIDLGENYESPPAANNNRVAGYDQNGQAYNSSGGPIYGPGVGNIGSAPIMRPSTGGGSYSDNRPYGSTGSQTQTPSRVGSSTSTTTPVAPGIAMPTLGDVPAVDEARIKRLTQTRSAAGQRALRSALREQILSASYQDNPNVAGMINRKSMEGFGQGIADVYSKAQAQATNEEERNRQMQWSRTQAVFNAAMSDYMKRFGSTQKTEYDYVNPNAPDADNPRSADYMSPGQRARQEMMGSI